MKTDGGGPAFPVAEEKVNGITYQAPSVGMSLRDYFAARAMHGQLGHTTNVMEYETVARNAYGIADAMLVERKK